MMKKHTVQRALLSPCHPLLLDHLKNNFKPSNSVTREGDNNIEKANKLPVEKENWINLKTYFGGLAIDNLSETKSAPKLCIER